MIVELRPLGERGLRARERPGRRRRDGRLRLAGRDGERDRRVLRDPVAARVLADHEALATVSLLAVIVTGLQPCLLELLHRVRPRHLLTSGTATGLFLFS